jgi:hypothetical protein
LATNTLSPPDIVGLREFIALGGTPRKFAACQIIQTIQREHIERVSSLRCQDGECLSGVLVEALKIKVFEGFEKEAQLGEAPQHYTPADCEVSDAPAPAVQTAKGLGTIRLRRGQGFSFSSSNRGARGHNEVSMTLVCSNGETIPLGTFTNHRRTYPVLPIDCNLEVRGSNGRDATTLWAGRPSYNEANRTYTFDYDDDTPGGVDFDDMIVNVTVRGREV